MPPDRLLGLVEPGLALVALLQRHRRTGAAAVAAAAGVRFMPGHNYIYEPPLQRTKELLSSGRLGALTAVYVMYNIHHPEDVCARYPVSESLD